MNVGAKVLSPWLPLGDLAERIEFILQNVLNDPKVIPINTTLLDQATKFLDTVTDGMRLMRSMKFLGAPIETLDAYEQAVAVFERLYKQDRKQIEQQDLESIIDSYNKALRSLNPERQAAGPPQLDDQMRQDVEASRRFFEVLMDVALEHLSQPMCRVVTIPALRSAVA